MRILRDLVLLSATVMCLVGWSFFDPFFSSVQNGNKKAKEGETEEALESYSEAARLDPSSPIPDFNRGVALSKTEPEQAMDAFRGAAAASDPAVAADALYNLGNVHMDAEQYQEAVETYLQSLDLDPSDDDARRNLEIAVQRLQEQQQQQEQDQNQDENEDQEEQDQEQQQQNDENEDEEQNEDEQQNSDEQQSEETPEEEEQQPQPQEDQLSREDAERLLNAIQSDELKVLDQLQEQQKVKGAVTRDW